MSVSIESTTSEPLKTVDGRPLKVALRSAQLRAQRRALYLVAPLFIFIVVTFAFPIIQMLFQGIYNDRFTLQVDPVSGEQTPLMTNLSEWFHANPNQSEPNEEAYAALATDLKNLRENRAAGQVGTRVNYEISGTRSLFTSTVRKSNSLEPPFKESILELNEDWGSPNLWRAMRDATSSYTLNFYLAAVDRKRNEYGEIVSVDVERQIYLKLFWRTLVLSLLITFLCFLLGFPVAHLLANLPTKYSNLLMILVLLPFWTSLLVRTTSWIVLLQSQGVVNDALVNIGLLGDENRIQMMYNQIGTIIAMTHILLPFMILPLYSVMRGINPSHVRAARSLGANSFTAFRRVYFPETIPGIGAGALLVFILAVGYYITPALVGGAEGQLISNLIAFHMQKSLNWSLAAALATFLFGGILLLYWLYSRLIGIENVKLG